MLLVRRNDTSPEGLRALLMATDAGPPAVGATNPSPGVLDFEHWRSVRAIYEAAKLAGIFVILRPGKPDVNS